MKLTKIKLPFSLNKSVLAFGADTKNALCFARGRYAYLTPPIGSLDDPKNFAIFRKRCAGFLKKDPNLIAHDLHPEYFSTKYAMELRAMGYELGSIQHHHAHIASCMAENSLPNQKVLGVAFDGTGLGDNRTLWGGEFLVSDYREYQRKAHFKEIPLLGGEKAILEPWRLLAFWLFLAGEEKLFCKDRQICRIIDKNKWLILKAAYLKGMDFPLTSSAGRLFDAVATLIIQKKSVKHEAELPIELERMASGYRKNKKESPFSFWIVRNKDKYLVSPEEIFKDIFRELELKKQKKEIAWRFHLTMARIIERTCGVLRKETKISKVVLSGGVFQNKLLTSLAVDLLEKNGFQVFTHKILSSGDASLSLGQAVIAGYSDIH